MITSIYDNEIIPKVAYFNDDGNWVGANCERVSDGKMRFYYLSQMKADGGLDEIEKALDGCSKHRQWEEGVLRSSGI